MNTQDGLPRPLISHPGTSRIISHRESRLHWSLLSCSTDCHSVENFIWQKAYLWQSCLFSIFFISLEVKPRGNTCFSLRRNPKVCLLLHVTLKQKMSCHFEWFHPWTSMSETTDDSLKFSTRQILGIKFHLFWSLTQRRPKHGCCALYRNDDHGVGPQIIVFRNIYWLLSSLDLSIYFIGCI